MTQKDDVKATRPAKLLHASDLHFGRGFNRPLWDNFKARAKQIQPDLVILTGDLVNSPWRWMLRRVAHELVDLVGDLQEANPRCTLLVVPGNHDTRLCGLLPVRWVRWLLCVCLGMAAVWAWFLQDNLWTVGLLGVFGAGGVALGMALSTDLDLYWGTWLVRKPRTMCDLGIEILPFDSASSGFSSARGRVELGNRVLVANKLMLEGDHPNLVRIAILHHHPLPLPYDSSSERMMILDNAGAFLKEMDQLKVALVLHGHKHHHHFSRIVIDPSSDEGIELAVLSTGTPTEGSKPGQFGFNFNAIELASDGAARVVPYHSSGGIFREGTAFFVERNDHHAQQRFLKLREKEGRSCQSLVSLISINSDGDGSYQREYRQLAVHGDPISGLPDVIGFRVHGHIDQFEVFPLANDGPALTLEWTEHDVDRQAGRITFGAKRTKEDDPLDFAIRGYGENAFAMTKAQHREMHDKDEEGIRTGTEFIQFRAPKTPVAEMTLVVRFPEDFRRGDQVYVESSDGLDCSKEETAWRRAARDPTLSVLRLPDTVVARIQFPLPGARYRFRWQLEDDIVGHQTPIGEESRLEEMTEWLEGLWKITPERQRDELPELMQLVEWLESESRSLLSLGKSGDLDVGLFVYNKKSRELLPRLATYKVHDERWDWRFKYGNGIVGRTFKVGRSTVFLREAMEQSSSPCVYLRGDGGVVVSPKDVPEAALLAVPLGHPSVRGRNYGVLRVSSSKNRSELACAIMDETVVVRFAQVMNLACYRTFDHLLSS